MKKEFVKSGTWISQRVRIGIDALLAVVGTTIAAAGFMGNEISRVMTGA